MTIMPPHLSFDACDVYMSERTGRYEYRAVRYRRAIEHLFDMGLDDSDTIYDIGAGWTEFDYCLRKEYDWRGRYVPVDASMLPLDLNTWVPERRTEFFVALELLEHLHDPERLLSEMTVHADKGVVCSVPNPLTVDVRGIDATHFSEPDHALFASYGYEVEEFLAYGGVYSAGKDDSLMAWRKI